MGACGQGGLQGHKIQYPESTGNTECFGHLLGEHLVAAT